MDFIYITAGAILALLFFFNMRSAVDILCRIIGGFAALMLYNGIASFLPIMSAGVNLISSAAVGFLGLPGMILLLLCKRIF